MACWQYSSERAWASGRYVLAVMPRFEQRFVGREGRRVSDGLGPECQLQRTNDGLGDFILNLEDVGELAVVPFGPADDSRPRR